jgi:hypothetical protein
MIEEKIKRRYLKMSQLKVENLKKCFSLLREFIDEAPLDNKKKIAMLALTQLQKITAGSSTPAVTGSSCLSRPRNHGVR